MSIEIKEYDNRRNLIYIKSPNGFERWMEYNKDNILVYFRLSTRKEFEFRIKEKEYLSREKVSRFEIMDI